MNKIRRTFIKVSVASAAGILLFNKKASSCSFGDNAYGLSAIEKEKLPNVNFGNISVYMKKNYSNYIKDTGNYVRSIKNHTLPAGSPWVRGKVDINLSEDEFCSQIDLVVEVDNPKLVYWVSTYHFSRNTLPYIGFEYSAYGYRNRIYAISHIKNIRNSKAKKIILSRVFERNPSFGDWLIHQPCFNLPIK